MQSPDLANSAAALAELRARRRRIWWKAGGAYALVLGTVVSPLFTGISLGSWSMMLASLGPIAIVGWMNRELRKLGYRTDVVDDPNHRPKVTIRLLIALSILVAVLVGLLVYAFMR